MVRRHLPPAGGGLNRDATPVGDALKPANGIDGCDESGVPALVS